MAELQYLFCLRKTYLYDIWSEKPTYMIYDQVWRIKMKAICHLKKYRVGLWNNENGGESGSRGSVSWVRGHCSYILQAIGHCLIFLLRNDLKCWRCEGQFILKFNGILLSLLLRKVVQVGKCPEHLFPHYIILLIFSCIISRKHSHVWFILISHLQTGWGTPYLLSVHNTLPLKLCNI